MAGDLQYIRKTLP